MGIENSIREDIKKESSRILYEDKRYFVGVSSQEQDAHHLLVNDAYAFLARGIFNELARTDTNRLESALGTIGEKVLNEMAARRIPLEELGWTLAKAAIKDQEDFVAYLSQ